MGSGASTSGVTPEGEITLEDLTNCFIKKAPVEELTRTNSTESICQTDLVIPESPDSESSLFHEYQYFVSEVKKNNITVRKAGLYVTKFPRSLFAIDYEGKSAIQHAGENRNIPLFHLLIRKKQEERRKQLQSN